jgi:hypothetical protein
MLKELVIKYNKRLVSNDIKTSWPGVNTYHTYRILPNNKKYGREEVFTAENNITWMRAKWHNDEPCGQYMEYIYQLDGIIHYYKNGEIKTLPGISFNKDGLYLHAHILFKDGIVSVKKSPLFNFDNI